MGSFPSVPVAAPGSYPAGSNTRPAYGYDNAFPDQVNFSGADPNRQTNVAAGVSAPIHNQVTGLIPTNLSGISANAFSSVLSNFKV